MSYLLYKGCHLSYILNLDEGLWQMDQDFAGTVFPAFTKKQKELYNYLLLLFSSLTAEGTGDRQNPRFYITCAGFFCFIDLCVYILLSLLFLPIPYPFIIIMAVSLEIGRVSLLRLYLLSVMQADKGLLLFHINFRISI